MRRHLCSVLIKALCLATLVCTVQAQPVAAAKEPQPPLVLGFAL